MTGNHNKQLFYQFMSKYKNSIQSPIQSSIQGPIQQPKSIIVYSKAEVNEITNYIQNKNLPFITNIYKFHECKYCISFEPFRKNKV